MANPTKRINEGQPSPDQIILVITRVMYLGCPLPAKNTRLSFRIENLHSNHLPQIALKIFVVIFESKQLQVEVSAFIAPTITLSPLMFLCAIHTPAPCALLVCDDFPSPDFLEIIFATLHFTFRAFHKITHSSHPKSNPSSRAQHPASLHCAFHGIWHLHPSGMTSYVSLFR
jgi:hypothetical protein